MICLLLQNKSLIHGIELLFNRHEIQCKVVDINDRKSLDSLYDLQTTLAIVEESHPMLPDNSWIDMLSRLCERIPILVIYQDISPFDKYKSASTLHCIKSPNPSQILEQLANMGCLNKNRTISKTIVPFCSPSAVKILHTTGSISLLCIQTESFKKIATEYGTTAYEALQKCFQQLLLKIWGAPDSFRMTDLLYSSSSQSNLYFILLQQSRLRSSVPPPGALEDLSSRLVSKLQSLLWEEIFKPNDKKILPSNMYTIPNFSIGYTTSLNNPCLNKEEIIQTTIRSGMEVAQEQLVRIKNRQKEFIQTLIRTPNFLKPHYQGVFTVKNLTREQIEDAIAKKSIASLEEHIYSFESLIRVNQSLTKTLTKKYDILYINSNVLRPDILFSLAGNVKLALELDQTCLEIAIKGFKGLPGRLMVNILPRNFYNLEKLPHYSKSDIEITYEVSESEAINNYTQLIKMRDSLNKSFGIAIDDFGKGYAGLDRILKIKPNIIKLDRCLVEKINEDQPKQAFVKGIIGAAKFINSKVLAEGVETIEEFLTLQSLGVELVQGYLFHRPESLITIQESLRKDINPLETVA